MSNIVYLLNLGFCESSVMDNKVPLVGFDCLPLTWNSL